MTTDPFTAFEFDADDAGRVLDEALVGADDGELFLETSASESLAFDDGRLKVAKLNVDENPGTPPKFGIRGIPTLMLFKDGAVADTKVGAASKTQLSEWVESVI